MKNVKMSIKLFVLLVGTIGFVLAGYPFGSLAQDQAALQPTRPGLNVEITDVTIPADRKPVVTLRITDNAKLPLDRTGVMTIGPVSLSFVIARIEPGATQYTSYITRTATGAVSGTVQQPTTDSGGTYAELGDGRYTYTFANALPESYNPNVTHTIGTYASRNMTEYDGRSYVANALFNFVPAGGPVTTVRDVVRTEACNQCHNVLGLHGGRRRETALCVLCHQPQNVDPDTGNPVDFKVMIHKIHMGANLPSVKAGTPYQIIGVNGRVFDFSTVAFPPSLGASINNLRNCARCHTGSQGDNWKTQPSRAACGSCHDDVNFQTGENHAGGLPQADDRLCSLCHGSSGKEFDISVPGAHAVPAKSEQLLGIRFEIADVTNTAPGQNPTVTFNIKDKNGNAIAPSSLDFLRLTIAGPTTDYAQVWQELDVNKAATGPDSNGNYSYTFTKGLPSDASGTYAIGIEGYKNVEVQKLSSKETVRDAGVNVVKYAAVTDSAPAARRKVVDLNNCNRCHDQLAMHGTIRRNTEYCIMCHNPNNTDAARRPPDKMPAETIHYKVLIHKIHRGEELENEYTVYGFGGRAFNFNEIRFPGDLRDCSKCHLPGTNLLPMPSSLLPTLDPRGPTRGLADPTMPIAAACTACHDSLKAADHAATMTAGVTREACAACHDENTTFAVSKMHAKVPGAIP
ncbi:MAG: OmcA/MtrC family decaheme c-type cytochrome [Acidobacteria bacterium]|nr:OmcA/MtrC family decaheme c-type cytochrome [Acidobacteriota bacterium]